MRAASVTSESRNRLRSLLVDGGADALCYVRPEWIDGVYNWTPSFIKDGGVVAARVGTPLITSLADLSGKPVGTVLGYRYPELESALGHQFVREDAPAMESNLRKLIAGRMEYAILEKIMLDYHLRLDKSIKVRTDLLYVSFDAQCAFSRTSLIPFSDVEQVINTMIKDGHVNEIFARYR